MAPREPVGRWEMGCHMVLFWLTKDKMTKEEVEEKFVRAADGTKIGDVADTWDNKNRVKSYLDWMENMGHSFDMFSNG